MLLPILFSSEITQWLPEHRRAGAGQDWEDMASGLCRWLEWRDFRQCLPAVGVGVSDKYSLSFATCLQICWVHIGIFLLILLLYSQKKKANVSVSVKWSAWCANKFESVANPVLMTFSTGLITLNMAGWAWGYILESVVDASLFYHFMSSFTSTLSQGWLESKAGANSSLGCSAFVVLLFIPSRDNHLDILLLDPQHISYPSLDLSCWERKWNFSRGRLRAGME